LSLLIAFYYALSGFACAVVYRRELARSSRRFTWRAWCRSSAAISLTYLLGRSVYAFVTDPEGTSETGAAWLGVAPPLVAGVALMLLGALLMVLWRVTGGSAFFSASSAAPTDAPAPAGS
jgi:hypothetical protein